jgi:uncharacterized protein
MAATSPFVVPVGELLRHPGQVRSVRVEAPVDWGVEYSVTLAEPPLVAVLDLTAVPGGVVIRGPAEVTMRSTCARCLAETDHLHRVEVAELARPGGDATEDGDEAYLLDGEQLDLEPIIRDEVLLALPLLWRCDPPCEGVAPGSTDDASGEELGESPQNGLNIAAPGQQSDSPFAALRDVFETGD